MKLILGLAALLACLPARAAAGMTGCVYDLSGSVEVMKPGGQGWLPAARGQELAEGDRLRASGAGWCELLFRDGTFVKLEDGAETALEELKAGAGTRSFSFSMLKGKILWMAAKMDRKLRSGFTVRTPSAVCAVRGTSFSIVVSSSGATTVGLFEGAVAVSGPARERPKEMSAGSEASASGGEVAVSSRLSRLMAAEERRYGKLKGRVEGLRRRLEARGDFLDAYAARQRKKISDMEQRRKEKLERRGAR